ALALAGDVPRRDCGAGFLAIVERASTTSDVATAALGLFGSRTFLRRRLMRILDSRRTLHRRLSARAALLLGVAALFVLPYVRAQDRPPPPTSPQSGRFAALASRRAEAEQAPATEAPSGQAIDFRIIG